MAVYEIDGRVHVGAQTFGRSGCAQLVAQTHGSVIDVEGVRYPGGAEVACTAVIRRFWEDVPLAAGTSEVTVRYRGRSGTYVFEHTPGGVHALHTRGEDVAPLMAEQWWQIPTDILAVQVWNGTQTAVGTVSERVHNRLLDEGAERFDRPPGVPIVPSAHGADQRTDLDEWWSEIAAAGEVSVRRRIYVAALDAATLQRIADEESRRDGCASVLMIRREEWRSDAAVRATPRCPSSS